MCKHTESKQNTRSGILICGSYGLGNAGDESILKAILQDVRSAAPQEEIIVLSRDPEETTQRHHVRSLHMFDFPGFHRIMRHARLYINGGGSLIQDVSSRRSLWYYLYTLRAAKKRGCKVLMYGCGIGPVNYPKDIDLTRRVLNRYVDTITLREDASREELQKFGVTQPKVILASDPALTLHRAADAEIDALMTEYGLDPGGKYLCLCLRPWKDFEPKVPVFAEVVHYAKAQYGLTPVFLSINHLDDGAAADAVAALLGEAPCVIRQPLSTELTLGLMSRMQAIISMRLHGLIFAAGQGIPLVGVVYDPKVSAFLSYMDQHLYEDLSMITGESLCRKLDAAMALHGDTAALESAVARLRSMGRNNTDALRELLDS